METISRENAIPELAGKIEGIRFAMFTTQTADGHLRSRPMTTQEAEFDGDLWFFTSVQQELVDEIQANPAVGVVYADDDKGLWVSMMGQASVLRDEAKMKELYNPAVKAYFPDGLEDPDLRLIKVEVDQAEYWEAPHSKAARLFNLAKAALTGKRDHQGEHGKIKL
ncbi:MAG: general stress protein [Meiothermus sp.]